MTPELFQSLLDCYGADLSRWPDDQQSAAGHSCANPPKRKLPSLRRWRWTN